MNAWSPYGPDPGPVADIRDGMGISEIEARILVNRGIRTVEQAREFLYPSLDLLHDPYLFDEMKKAVDLLADAIGSKRRILVHGDYDADGICGTALLYSYLSGAGADVHYFVPHRAKDGYGLSMRMMRRCVE
ncbi:MAG TPA: DHH family phosphoesterase, partial [Candidatus Krumholzibacterium sp.]|nr:DHH family phosphoesterase [Candidatus Krumholzibacterium sp.]